MCEYCEELNIILETHIKCRKEAEDEATKLRAEIRKLKEENEDLKRQKIDLGSRLRGCW